VGSNIAAAGLSKNLKCRPDGLVVSSPPTTEQTITKGRAIESPRGKFWRKKNFGENFGEILAKKTLPILSLRKYCRFLNIPFC
jgi:hypothetical protein